MSELKCCPFCSSNNIKVGSIGTSLGIDNYIKCVDCGAKIQICDEYGIEHLEKLWNHRKPMANIVEKLEERRIEYELSSENAPDVISSTYRKGIMRGYEYSRDLVKQEINNGLE